MSCNQEISRPLLIANSSLINHPSHFHQKSQSQQNNYSSIKKTLNFQSKNKLSRDKSIPKKIKNPNRIQDSEKQISQILDKNQEIFKTKLCSTKISPKNSKTQNAYNKLKILSTKNPILTCYKLKK